MNQLFQLILSKSDNTINSEKNEVVVFFSASAANVRLFNQSYSSLIYAQCLNSYDQLTGIQSYSNSILVAKSQVSLSFWFRYQPIFQQTSQYFPVSTSGATYTNQGQLLMSVFDPQAKLFRMLSFFDKNNLELKTEIINSNKKVSMDCQLDQDDYEGIWMYQQFFISQKEQTLTHLFYNYHTQYFQKDETSFILENNKLEITLGGYGYFQDYRQNLYFDLFNGQISTLNYYEGNIDFTNAAILSQNLNACISQFLTCDRTSQTLINDATYFTGSNQTQISLSTISIDNTFKLEGWFILQNNDVLIYYIQNYQTYTLLELRNQNTSSLEVQYDKNLLFRIQYQIVNPLVKLQFLAQSYENTLLYSNKQVLESTQDLKYVEEWHYVTFIYDRENKVKSGVFVTFPQATENPLQMFYLTQVLFLTGDSLYITLGANIQLEQYFQGQLSKITINSCFDRSKLIPQIQCHETCETCTGPNNNQCKGCYSHSNRVITQGTYCTCLNGFFQFANQKICYKLDQLTFFSISEIESTQTNCRFGEFLVNYEGDTFCIKCPQQSSDSILHCGDCLENQSTWQYNLICTYNYELNIQNDLESTYKKIDFDSELYLLDLNTKSIIDCVGCQTICIENDCQLYSYSNFGQAIYIRCKQNYYYKNGYCIQCDQYCKICSGNYCQQCIDNYYYDPLLQICIYQIITINNCGYQCKNCINGQNQCIICNDNYKLSIDGINCEQNEIVNCLQEYNIQTIQNIVQLINIDSQQNINTQNICSYCQTNNYNMDSNQCLTKQQQTCQYSITISTIDICLIGNQQSIAQITDCQSNCQLCVKDNTYINGYCVQCQIGYYLDLLYGICQKCPSSLNCKSCYLNLLKPDNQNIYTSLVFLFQQGLLYSYQQSLLQLDQSSFKILCIECNTQLTIFDSYCYDACPAYCDQCQVINYQQTCVRCKPKSQKIQSHINCLECPSNCLACSERTEDEIITINPLFDLDNLNFNKYTHKCYKPSESNSFLSTYFQTTLQCINNQNCLKAVHLQLDAYCLSEEYQSSLLTNDEFPIYSTLLSDLQNHFETQFYNTEFLEQLNDLMIQQITITIMIKSGSKAGCAFSANQLILNQQFQQYIFALETVNIEIKGEQLMQLEMPNKIYLQNYTQVSFENIRFYGVNQAAYINVRSYFLNFAFSITNCVYTSDKTSEETKSLNFDLGSVKSFALNGFTIENTNLYEQNIFDIDVATDSIISIKGLTFSNSDLKNVVLFSLSNPYNSDCLISIENIQVNSIFVNSSILEYTNQTQIIGTLSIGQVTISNSQFFGSKHVIASYAQYNSLINMNLTSSYFYNTSSLLFIYTLNMEKSYFENCVIEQGYLITNQGYGSLSQSYFDISLQTLLFQEITYYSNNQFINIQDENHLYQITISDLVISNNTAKGINYQDYCVFLQGDTLNLNSLNITKNIGNIDVFIEFNTISIQYALLQQSDDRNIIIQPSLFCLSSYYDTDLYTSLLEINVLKQLIIDDLKILNVNVINQPIIKIIGSNQSTITISNLIIQNNKIIISQNSLHTAIFYYQSSYQTTFQMINSLAQSNILYSYVIDKDAMLASILLILNSNGNSILDNNQFLSNFALNTTFSINYIKSMTLLMTNSIFQQNNYNDLELIYDKVSDSFPDDVSIEQIWNTYSILSIGGNGQYYGVNVTIKNNIFNQSTAAQGGGVYLQTVDSGIIIIKDCNFEQLHGFMDADSTSEGGALYLDATYAQLNLFISDCKFTNIFAKVSGGVIYIKSSSIANNVQIENIQLNDCVALLGSFIYAIFPISDISTIKITNINWSAKQDAINNYLAKLQGFTSEYENSLKNYGALVAIAGGIIKLQNFRVVSNYYFGIGAFHDYEALLVFDVEVFSTQSLFYNAFSFGANEISLNAYTVFNQILLDSINSNLIEFSNGCSSPMLLDVPSVFLKCSQSQIYRRGFITLITEEQSNQDCNLNLLQTYALNQGMSKMDVFHIAFLNSQVLNQLLSLSSVTLINSNISQLDYVIDNQNAYLGDNRNKSFQLAHHLTIKNKIYQYLLIVASSEENQRLLQSTNSFTCQALITNIITHCNQAYAYPGGFLGDLKIVIENYVITNITFTYRNVLQISMTQAIFMSNLLITDCQMPTPKYSYPVQFTTGSQSCDIIQSNDVFAGNTISGTSQEATNFVTKQAEKLGFSSDGETCFNNKEILRNDTTVIDQIYIAPYKAPGYENKTSFFMFPSGQEISSYQYFDLKSEQYYSLNLNLSLILLNRESEILMLQTAQVINISVSYRKMNESKHFDEPEFTSLLNITSTNGTNQFFLNDMIIQFDPYSSSEMYYQLMFQTSYIYIPVYSDVYPYEQVSEISNYQLRLNVKTYKCQIGEFIYLDQCKKCDDSQNYYQVMSGQSFCYLKDDASMISVKPYTVQMRSGYWRYLFQSITVEYCYHYPTNCLGGWKYGNPTCVTGHIGALCEQCDLYNIRGEGSYSVSSQYTCGTCSDTRYNIIIIVVIALLYVLFLFSTLTMGIITVKSSIDDTEEFILRNKIKAFGIAPSVRILSTILIKMLTNYAQIISSVFTFQLQLPPQIQQSTVSVGNPTQSMVYSLDCFLVSLSKLTIMYLEFIWMLATPFFFISIIYIIFFTLILLKLKRFNIGIITTTLIYFYIYMQPNLIQNMISQLSKRTISDVQFVQGNVSYEFYTSTHMKWLGFVITPILIVLGGVIPFSLWYQVFKNKLHLDDITVRLPWGFYYNEYKKQAYYWETVKLLQKQTIIIALNYYEDEVSIKASLVLLIVFIYHVLSDKINPYYVLQLNRLDTQSTVVCSISIILCSAIYQAQTQGISEIVWPFYIISGLLNIWYVLNLLIQIVFSYLAQYQELFDKIKNIITRSCPYLIDKYPYIKDLLTTKQQRQKRIRERFAKIREYLFRKAKRAVRARKLTLIQSPELYYQRRGGISSPSPFNLRQLDMIDSQSQIGSPIPRANDHSNQTIRLVETVYASRKEDAPPESNTRRDEFQIEDDNLSPQVVYISINPKLNTRSQLM